MSFWTAVVVIVAIISIAEIVKSKHRAHRGPDIAAPTQHPSLSEEHGGARREIDELRERIKVLERIATDGNTLDASETRRISQEIEALRDRQDG